jgi:tetratricopeptide (TPR) repeat protein
MMNSILRTNDDILLISKVWSIKNHRLIRQERYNEAFDSCEALIEFCRSRGLIKLELVKEEFHKGLIYLKTNQLLDALMQFKKALGLAKKYYLGDIELECRLYKVFVLLQLNHIIEPFNQIRKMKQILCKSSNHHTQALGYYIIALVQVKFGNTLFASRTQIISVLTCRSEGRHLFSGLEQSK